MEQRYTMEEVLQYTIDILNRIQVPGACMKDIGVPIMNALDNLKAMQDAMNAARTEADNGRETEAE